MIRNFEKADLDVVMEIWLSGNIDTHHYIPQSYWEDNFEMVREILPNAEVYVYVDEALNQVLGFIGLTENYVSGLFVSKQVQSQGIGKELLDYAKEKKEQLTLSAYKRNLRAISFYQREQFVVKFESLDKNTGEMEFLLEWNR